ncbi:MFS transporter [Streptomyces sp. QL37]|uniref:MFS transporter n=1 Tax=Streptomyces sp. QL37 TaxID=2093747 RepID=UPI000CF1C952|nr:MFS transporter [Streptomyces sp. QL37]PPQ57496.1 MFS transporter [Streptomyces sp. QL37]
MNPKHTSTPPDADADPGSWGARWWTLLFVLSGNMVLDAVEVSVVLVALPSIGADLGLSLLSVQWLMSGFALGFAALLTLGPRVNARFGRRRAYLGAMLVFAAASVAGGFAESEGPLIATRVVKGFCAALTAPTGLAIISTTFQEGPGRRRAVSVYSLFGAVGFTVGVLLSAVALESSWRWTFLFPAPVALLLFFLAMRLIPRDPDPARVPSRGLAPLLRDGWLVRSGLGAATLNGTYAGMLLLVTFLLQERWGWSPWQCALALLPACVPLAVAVPFAGRLVGRFGTARLTAAGALAPVIGCGLCLWRIADGGYWTAVLPMLLLVEAGFVLSFAALNMQATSTVEAADRARAVPLYQTGVQLGGVLTLPLVALLMTVYDGYSAALSLLTAVGTVGFLIALTGLRRDAAVPTRPATPS